MQTECTPALFEFEPVERKKVVAGFDGGTITSDAGALLLGRLDRGLGLIRRMACQRRSKISPPGRSKTSPLNVMRYAVLGGCPGSP